MDIRSMQSLGTLVFVAAIAAVVGIVHVLLLVLRRGSGFGWLVPAMLATALLPLAVAAAATGREIHTMFSTMALTGSGGVAAIAAGLCESRLFALVGSASVVAILGSALLAVAVAGAGGSAEAAGGEPSGGRRLALLAFTPVAALLIAGLLAQDLRFGTLPLRAISGDARAGAAGLAEASAMLSRNLTLLLVGGLGCIPAALLLAILGHVLAPRTPPPATFRALSLVLLLVLTLGAATAAVVTWQQMAWLEGIALTGQLPPSS